MLFYTFLQKYVTLKTHNSTLKGAISSENALIRKLSTRSSVLEGRKYLRLEKRQQITKTNHFFDIFVYSRIFLHLVDLFRNISEIFVIFQICTVSCNPIDQACNPIDQTYKPYRSSMQPYRSSKIPFATL